MQAKLRAAAEMAAKEAAITERGRCLWCLDQVLREMKKKIPMLLTEVQRHAIDLKIRIAEAVSMELRRAIVSGVRPAAAPSESGAEAGKDDVTSQADTADVFPLNGSAPCFYCNGSGKVRVRRRDAPEGVLVNCTHCGPLEGS